jgi:hypothetical protein
MSLSAIPAKTHFFHAQAVGAGGRITRPFQELIEVQAATALPIGGGRGTSRVENFNFKNILSFKLASAHVTGSASEDGKSFATLAQVVIEDLNILDVITAKKIVSRITSHHGIDDKEPSITPLGSRFEGLRIAGCRLEVDLNTDFPETLATYKGFREANTSLQESKGIIVTTLVKDIQKRKACPEVKIVPSGNVIELAHFGRIYLAQFLLTSYSRRLIMLRVDLGCPVGGSADVGCVIGNGSTYP